jgi:hypothetical protein
MIDIGIILQLLVAAALVAVGCSFLIQPVRDPSAGGGAAPGLPGATAWWARPVGGLVALLGVAAGVALIWPGLDRVTAGAAMAMGVLLFALGMALRRGEGSGEPGTPRPRAGILLTGAGIATAAMILGVALAGRLA